MRFIAYASWPLKPMAMARIHDYDKSHLKLKPAGLSRDIVRRHAAAKISYLDGQRAVVSAPSLKPSSARRCPLQPIASRSRCLAIDFVATLAYRCYAPRSAIGRSFTSSSICALAFRIPGRGHALA